MAQNLRILHVANVALGTPYTGLSYEKCRERYERFPAVFDELFDYIEREGIDLVLVAGNLYGRFLTSEDAAHLIARLEKASACRFVIAPGADDFYSPDSLYASGRLPANVHIFETDTLEHIDFDDIAVTVYGWAVLEQRRAVAPLKGAAVSDPERINLVVGSCDINARTLFVTATPEDIAAFGADYAAFAHGPATEILTAGKTRYAHAGFIEGRGFEEEGVGGFLRIDITHDKEERRVEGGFVPISRHRYETVMLDVTGASGMEEVEARILALIADEGIGEETSLRVVLQGELHPTVILQEDTELITRLPLYSIHLVDETIPTYGAEELERDMTLRGQVYRIFHKRLSAAVNTEDRVALAHAMRLCLAALDSRDMTGL